MASTDYTKVNLIERLMHTSANFASRHLELSAKILGFKCSFFEPNYVEKDIYSDTDTYSGYSETPYVKDVLKLIDGLLTTDNQQDLPDLGDPFYDNEILLYDSVTHKPGVMVKAVLPTGRLIHMFVMEEPKQIASTSIYVHKMSPKG